MSHALLFITVPNMVHGLGLIACLVALGVELARPKDRP